jgi:hypothetical protein
VKKHTATFIRVRSETDFAAYILLSFYFCWVVPLLHTHCRVQGCCFTWSHTCTHAHFIWLPWIWDRPVAEASTWQHTTLARDRPPVCPAEFEPTIPATELPQTHAFDRAATGICRRFVLISSRPHLAVLTPCTLQQPYTLPPPKKTLNRTLKKIHTI